VAKVKE